MALVNQHIVENLIDGLDVDIESSGKNIFLKKLGQSRPLFVYCHSFLITISIQIEKSIDGVLGIQTWSRRMVGADETTELWRPPKNVIVKIGLWF